MLKDNRFFFLTRSLDPLTVGQNNINTSSKKFESGFVKALSRKCNLEIIYIGKVPNCENVHHVNGNIPYLCIDHHSVRGVIVLLKYITESDRNNIVITTAYYPLLSLILLISKIFDVKVFSYIYDTHRSATENMKRIKRFFANLYFSSGFMMVKRFNGLLVLNDRFIKKNKIRTPYLKTRIGIELDQEYPTEAERRDISVDQQKVLCFAGTLNKENGVGLLLEVFRENKKLNYQLHFYGYGELEKDIELSAKQDDRIRFFGNIPQDILQKKFREADYLINLRDPDALSSDYAFPSKFIEYLSTGRPVISNLFPALEDIYIPYMIPIDSFDKEAVVKCLNMLHHIDDEVEYKRKKVLPMLRANNNWNDIVDEIITFVKKDIDA